MGLVDDDTYINLDYFHDTMKDKDPSIPMVYSGCLIYFTWRYGIGGVNKEEWRFPFGGYGLFFSRGSIERMMQPLRCHQETNKTEFETSACKQLQKNYLYEKINFKRNSSVSDIAFQISSQLLFCLHSDDIVM